MLSAKLCDKISDELTCFFIFKPEFLPIASCSVNFRIFRHLIIHLQ